MSGYGPVRKGRVPTWVQPPAAAQRIASSALARQADLPPSRRGGLGKTKAKKAGITSGVERAESIARGDLQPAEDIRDFFARFEGTHTRALEQGKPWEQSKVQQVWDLWGGGPMREAALVGLEAEVNPMTVPPDLRRPPRHGACVIVIRGGRVLAITNGHDRFDLNLPGGGVDLGESFAQAAVRELREETQVDASRATLIPVRHRKSPWGTEHVAFLAVGDLRFPPRLYSDPFEGYVEWRRPLDLLQPRCRHGRTNRQTFARIGLI